MQHGDETKPIENPEAHIKKYRESVMIMKQNSTLARRGSKYRPFLCFICRFPVAFLDSDLLEGVRLSQKPRSSMKFLSTGQQRSSRIVSQSSNMSNKNFTQTRTSIRMGDDLRKRTPANSIRIK